jgi:lipoxygenase
MLKPRVHHQSHTSKTLFLYLHKGPFVHGINGGTASSLSIFWSKSSFQKKKIRTGFVGINIKAVASRPSPAATEKYFISVKAVVTVKPTVGGFLSNLEIERGLDDIKDLLGKTLLLEPVSTQLHPSKSLQKNRFFLTVVF